MVKSKCQFPVEIVGSLYRGDLTDHDIDLAIIADNLSYDKDKPVEFYFKDKPPFSKSGSKRAQLVLNNFKVDLFVIPERNKTLALNYLRSTKNENAAISRIAKNLGMKYNNMGLFDKKNRKISIKNVNELYTKLGMTYPYYKNFRYRNINGVYSIWKNSTKQSSKLSPDGFLCLMRFLGLKSYKTVKDQETGEEEKIKKMFVFQNSVYMDIKLVKIPNDLSQFDKVSFNKAKLNDEFYYIQPNFLIKSLNRLPKSKRRP